MQKYILKASLLMVLSTAAVLPLRGISNIIIVENHQPRALVVTADDPSPTAEYAAEELVWHVNKATGVKLDIVPESKLPEEPAARIFVGVTQAALDAGINPEDLKPDEALLRTVDGNLFILGRENDEDPLSQRNNHAGTLFGVYELLERSLDVRWLWPGELGTYVPRTDNFAVSADIDLAIEPAIPHRHIWGTVQLSRYRSGAQRNAYRKDLNIYNRRHRLGQTEAAPSPAHSFRDAGDGETWWERYGEEHPEWFALNEEGERVNTGICVSNPELHEYITGRYKEYLEKGFEGAPRMWRNGPEWVVLGDRDSGWRPCQCEDCLAWDGPIPEDPSFSKGLYERFGWFGTSDRYARFNQAVYEKAARHNPDVKVAGYLYWSYFPAPTSDLEISPNVYGHYTPWGTAGIVHFPLPQEAIEWKKNQWLGWRDSGMSMIYRPNYWFGGYVMPHITWQGGEFFQWAYNNEMAGFKYWRYRDNWAIQGPMNYMYFRLFSNPDREIPEVLEEYYTAFGPAAEYVKQYTEYWEAYARERHRPVDLPPGLMIGEDYKLARHIQPLDPAPLQNPAAAADAYPKEKFPAAEALLNQAMIAARQASNTEYAERVKFLQKGLEHAKLATQFWDSLEIESAVKANIPEESKSRRKAIKAFAELENFRHRHGDSYIVNFGDASQKESRAVDIEKLRNLKQNLNLDSLNRNN